MSRRSREPHRSREKGPSAKGEKDLTNLVSNVASTVRNAKSKDARMHKPVGGIPNARSFSHAEKWSDEAPAPRGDGPQLSSSTAEGLQQMADLTEATAAHEEMAEEAAEEEVTPEVQYVVETPEDAESRRFQKMRERTEEDLQPIDIGAYLMSGIVKQTVPVIPGHLQVAFRTARDGEEFWTQTYLREHLNADSSAMEFSKLQAQLALALHVHAYNGTPWAEFGASDDREDFFKKLEQRLKLVRSLPNQISMLLSSNLVWFLERTQESINIEILGNG